MSKMLPLCLMLLLLMFNGASSKACHKDDLKGLLDFKAGVQDQSKRLDTWTGVECCSWATITCDNVTGRVVKLDIEGNYDAGDSIGYDTVNGTISESLGLLTSLEMLALSQLNQLGPGGLTGSIPASLGNIPTLKRVFLDGNMLTGSIPSSFGKLSQLTQLYLNQNQLTGSIPSGLGTLDHLRELVLESNHLSGSLPSFSGKSLEKLDASKNKLTGSIPSSLAKLPRLTELLLESNQLSGSIPSSLGSSSPNLQDLRLSSNQLSGSLPASLEKATSLRNIFLGNNRLSGSIPSSWGRITNLSAIDLSSNKLSGQVPSSLSSLQQLSSLQLASNQLSGALPDLSSCSQLGTLDISFNKFHLISVPAWIRTVATQNYFWLSLASCGLQGRLPSFLSELNLGLLDLSSNSINGGLPDLSSSRSGLFHLNLSHNPLQASLSSANLSSFSILDTLDLSSTLLSGPLSAVFGCTRLSNLRLSGNAVNGSITAGVSALSELISLDASSNRLSGSVPRELLQLPNLVSLDLSHNLLSGRLPSGDGIRSFPASSFASNPGLCGSPLPPCS